MIFQRSQSESRCLASNLALWFVFLSSVPPAINAESGQLTRLPATRTFVPSNVTLEIDSRWAAGNGYRPVRCTVSNWPTGPATTDRTFQIVLEPRTGQYRHYQPIVQGYVELARGQRSAQIELYCPQSYWWNSVQVQMFEGSKELREMRSSAVGFMAGMVSGQSTWSEAVPSLLFVSSHAGRSNVQLAGKTDFPKWDRLVTSVPGYPSHVVSQDQYRVAADDLAVHTVIASQARSALVEPHRLPDRWLGLSTVDFVFISASDLALLSKRHPRKIEALKQWVEVGGNLCIEDVGNAFELIRQIEDELDLTSSGTHAGVWTPLPRKACEPLFRQSLKLNSTGYRIPAYRQADPNLIAPRVQPLAMGRVFIIADGAQWSDPSFAPWIFNSLPENRWAWYKRNGMTLNRQYNDFWNWSIRGIGRPPIFLFLTVITVFAAFIGPINFIAMKRWNRHYLLLVTVPVISLVTTVSLFGYGLIKDGVGTTVRRRAYVHLDQASGRMQSWSRQTYYASMAPYGGLQFPLTAAVYPILLEPVSGRQSTNPHLLQWTGSQRLRRGYIASRTLSQYLVVQPTKSTAANLSIAVSDEKLSVRNELGGSITHLLVCDEQGQLHSGHKLAVGETATLKPTDGEDIATIMREALIESFTSEIDPGLVRRTWRYWYGDQVDENLPEPDDETSLMEHAIADVRGGVIKTLRPRTYVAIMSSSSLVSMGVAKAKDRDSVIVVRGRW